MITTRLQNRPFAVFLLLNATTLSGMAAEPKALIAQAPLEARVLEALEMNAAPGFSGTVRFIKELAPRISNGIYVDLDAAPIRQQWEISIDASGQLVAKATFLDPDSSTERGPVLSVGENPAQMWFRDSSDQMVVCNKDEKARAEMEKDSFGQAQVMRTILNQSHAELQWLTRYGLPLIPEATWRIMQFRRDLQGAKLIVEMSDTLITFGFRTMDDVRLVPISREEDNGQVTSRWNYEGHKEVGDRYYPTQAAMQGISNDGIRSSVRYSHIEVVPEDFQSTSSVDFHPDTRPNPDTNFVYVARYTAKGKQATVNGLPVSEPQSDAQ